MSLLGLFDHDNLMAQFLRDRTRWFLWFPALIGSGIAIYFSLLFEPDLSWVALPVPLLLLIYALKDRAVPSARLFIGAVCLVSIGFSAAILRTEIVTAPILQKKLVTELTGRVLEKSTSYKSAKFLIGDLRLETDNDIPSLAYVRLSSRTNFREISPGQIVKVKAVLLPPPEPAYPGGYDFQRHSFFKSIGAVGYSISAFDVVGQEHSLLSRMRSLSSEIRASIAEFVIANAPPEDAGFAIAIMTGDKAAIPEDQLDAMRFSGLAHLLAISGMHMGMIGGLIFFAVRFLMVLSPYIALYYPVKKVAAIVALIGLAGYLFVSGMSVSAIRAFIMIAALFLAICFDRTALSLRMVAIAAVIILILFPESLVSASFQMSFAAVFALISLYEQAGPALSRFARSGGMIRRGVAYIVGVALTSLVAGLATAPFALYHFGQVATYSLIANLFAVPIMGLWVMPGVILAFIGLPFDFTFPLSIVGSGIDLILWVAHETATLPDAVLYLGTFSALQLIGGTFIGLWFIIWRQPVRWIALPMLVALMLTIFSNRSPDILISDSGNLYALKTGEGETYYSSQRADRFEADRWRLVMGMDVVDEQPSNLVCDPSGCVLRQNSELIAFPETMSGVEMDCRRANIIVSRIPAPKNCKNAQLVIDKFDLWRRGSHSLYFMSDGKLQVDTANDLRGDRPWVPERYRNRPEKAE
ncbi:ComEC/Rec2 family competence protein [Sneathiella sp. HT1-7]|uniref:ComEC/Rec2 family competence protein n=1 Tax=Sneathiella sp. HT1-7 TaxID=2887192 RepID=UPI001D14A9DD|nr:ComEC/Rec2 family competence protein [Sneathiella sp. HT1-7]MCC3306095.1 ComEC family competence protein [Sneathiella sp. HT1-7]